MSDTYSREFSLCAREFVMSKTKEEWYTNQIFKHWGIRPETFSGEDVKYFNLLCSLYVKELESNPKKPFLKVF